MDKYTLKPLKWTKNIVNENIRSYWCNLAPFGDYVIQRQRIDGKWEKNWTITYKCGDYESFSNQFSTTATSRAAAEACAERDWSRILRTVLRRAR